jgi:hypothetical protein
VVVEAFMSTSAGGGGGCGAGECAWGKRLGDCGGLENEGDEGCWLKCSGCSTLTLMAGQPREGAFDGVTMAGRCTG